MVNQPLGWKQAKSSLTRDAVFHSLVEFFKGSFIWYGTARAVIREVEGDQGPGAILRVTIEEFYSAWTTIFDGLIDISQIEDITKAGTFYKNSAPVIRDGFWARFINRKSIPADVGGSVDMDGNAIAPHISFTMGLPAQKVIAHYESEANNESDVQLESALGSTVYVLMGSSGTPILNEISKFFNYGTKLRGTNPVDDIFYVLQPEFPGVYDIVLDFDYAFTWDDGANRPYSMEWFITTIMSGVRTNTQIGATQSGSNILGFTSGAAYNLTTSLNLSAGDSVFIYGVLTLSGTGSGGYNLTGTTFLHTFTIEGNTTYPDTDADVFNMQTVWESVLEKITGQVGCLESDFFSIGCGKNYNLTKGACLRGYSLTDKPLALSADDIWKGCDPLFNIGLGYKEVLGVKKFKVEKKSFFYDKTPTVFFDNVPNFVRTYDLEKIVRSITIGFKSWSTESGSGVDDPQTKHTYNSGFPTIGKDISLLSELYAASLGIEQARRKRKEKNNDYRLDEANIIIASTTASGQTLPELDENFTSITNLLNADTRYNSRLTPAENFLRWREYFNGCMQLGSIGRYIFSSGEGNTSMTSQLDGGDCDPSDFKAENGDIDVTGDFTFLPEAYRCSIPMTRAEYNSILAAREKAVGMSEGVGNYLPYFIIDLDFGIISGQADFTLLLADKTIIP